MNKMLASYLTTYVKDSFISSDIRILAKSWIEKIQKKIILTIEEV